MGGGRLSLIVQHAENKMRIEENFFNCLGNLKITEVKIHFFGIHGLSSITYSENSSISYSENKNFKRKTTFIILNSLMNIKHINWAVFTNYFNLQAIVR